MNRTIVWLVLPLVISSSGAATVGQAQSARSAATPVRVAASATLVKASNPDEDDRLGSVDALTGVTVAISRDGRTMAASSPYEDSAATGINGDQRDNSASDSGAVYLFARDGNRWVQQAYLKASNTARFDKFGFSVALSGDGNTLAVAAPFEDGAARGINGNQADNNAENAGAVYVFVRRAGGWAQQAYVKASNTDAGDQFGWSLVLSEDGSTLAVGATGEGSAARGVNANQADNTADLAGAVYVFARAGEAWSQQAYLKASNAGRADLFGFCVALSGDGTTLAVGAYDEDGSTRGINGADDDGAAGSGAAYVFLRRGATWSQEAYLKASNTDKDDKLGGDAFGSSIALSGDGTTLGIGALDEDSLSPGIDGNQDAPQNPDGSAGALFIFARAGKTWAQQAYIKSSNIQATDQFAIRFTFSHDGNVLAAGAPLQNGGGRGLNQNQADFSSAESGAVYVFTRSSHRWAQSAYVKSPNADPYDQFGSAVALSGDGSTMAVSAGGEDGGTPGVGGKPDDNSLRDSGAVYIY